jgi:hypothetical protein
VATEIRYPNYHFASNPSVVPYSIGTADTILLANAAFRGPRRQLGLALYPGVGELDLSSLYDTHAYSAVAQVHGVANRPGFVRTAHGLTLIPELAAEAPADGPSLSKLDRLVVIGDPEAAASLLRTVSEVAPGVSPTLLPDDNRFVLDRVIEDLGASADTVTARFALRRLEYRTANIRLHASKVPWSVLPLPLASGLVGVALAAAARTYFTNRR